MIGRHMTGLGLGRVVLLAIAAVIFLMLALVLIGLLSSTPEAELTDAGIKRNSSFYITMRDGVKIAADVWLPADLQPGRKIPATLRFTRYIRALESGFVRRVALGLGFEGVHPIVELFNSAGYAVVMVDARGSGASSGTRDAEISPQEVSDMAEVADWVVRQSWSNGKVAAFGVSYVGTTAEMLAINGHSAVKAVMPLFSDFDGYRGLIRPGGVYAEKFVRNWGQANEYSDSNNLCQGASGLSCVISRLWFKGIKPVDSDTDGKQLSEIIRQRNNYDISATLAPLSYIDDPVNGLTMQDNFPAGNRAEISQSGVPMQIWVSWLDAATVNGAIGRFNSFSNPQQLIIAPFNHGGGKNADPYMAMDAEPQPTRLEQYQERIEFLDKFLKTDTPARFDNMIRYYTQGENVWKTTDIWPPRGIEKRRWYMGRNQRLMTSPPTLAEASDSYRVDFSATTGPQNRWLANLSGSRDIVYPDRAEQDRKLLVYDSDPLQQELEITGVPIVTLQLESSHSDGALHVYFEDVSPDGRVTYITEGILRIRHRKESENAPPYYMEGPYHSLKREDAMPLTEGEIAEIRIGLITTSVLIKAGHRLRIAIAGHDSTVFERIPKQGTPEIKIHRNRESLSFVDFPVVAQRPRTE